MSATAQDPATTDADSGPVGSGQLGVWARLRRNHLAVFGMVVVTVIVAIALAAPILPLAHPNVTDTGNRLLPPFSDGHLLGTDQLGRDMLSRLVWGTRISLAVGAAATVVAMILGTLIGLLAAYYGRFVDNFLMRGVDMLMAFPYLLLALAIVAVLGPGLFNALLAISIVNIPFFARAVRGATVSLVNREFIEAAHLAGYSNFRVITRELLPNVAPVIVITMSTTVGWMILETAGLSFLGLGAQPPQADLGSMLGQGRSLISSHPHLSVIPGVVILVLVIGINLLGDGLRDILDPRLKSGALSRPVALTDAASAKERAARATDGEHAEAASPTTAPDTAETVLSVENLETQFHIGREVYRAVNDVSFEVHAGEALGIVGESGSGKSVTAMSILGLVPTPPGRIVGGRILYRGEDLVGAKLERLRQIRGNRIAYIFQDPMTTLNPLFTVGDQITEAIRVHQPISYREAWSRTVDLLDQVQIPQAGDKARAYPHELSGGQRQRVVIAMALANDPDLLIADEPTTALDVTTQARILRMLDELRREKGSSLIFITHDLGVVSEVCDRVQVMYAGRIVETGPVADVFDEPKHPYTRRLMSCVPILGHPERMLDAIPGLPPAVNRLPTGCAFAPRCDVATDACRAGEIAMDTLSPTRSARCIHARATLADLQKGGRNG